MRYRVTGTNHQTGARMTLEVEGGSKAAAERKARDAGMDVQHAEPLRDDGGTDEHHGSRHRGQDPGRQTGLHPVIKTSIFLVVGLIAGWIAYRYFPR